MSSNTPNINLLKKDPTTDGNDTFNIKTMLNDNWDKIDAAVGSKANTNQIPTRTSQLTNDSSFETTTGSQQRVNTAIQNLINNSPAALDTLKELADALGDDPNFSTTIINMINGLAGAGRTTETVKGIADAQSGHLADYAKHPAISSTTGTSTAYVVTLNPALTSYAGYFGITIIPHVDCGDNPTININGLGAKTLYKQDLTPFSAGDIKQYIPRTFRCNGTNIIETAGGGGSIGIGSFEYGLSMF